MLSTGDWFRVAGGRHGGLHGDTREAHWRATTAAAAGTWPNV